MAAFAPMRSLRRMDKSNICIYTSVLSHNNDSSQANLTVESAPPLLQPSSLLPSQPPSASMKPNTTSSNPSPIKMNHQYPHLERQGTDSADVDFDLRKTGRGRARKSRAHRYATVIDGAIYSAGATTQAVGHFTTTKVASRGRSMRRASVSTARSVASCLRSRRKSVVARFRARSQRRPTISEPDHPKLVSSMAGAQGMEQPLVRHDTLMLEGDPLSSHDADIPDPLRCHPVQPRADDRSPAASSPPFRSALQNLTSSQRWKRAHEQENHLLMTLRQQLDAQATEVEQSRHEITQLQYDLEEQRTRAEHFQTALATAQKENVADYLAAGSPADVQAYVATMENEVRVLLADKIHFQSLAQKETLSVNTQKVFLDIKTRQIENLQLELEQEQAKSLTLRLMLEEREQTKLSSNSKEAAAPSSQPLPVTTTPEQRKAQAIRAASVASFQSFKDMLVSMGLPANPVSSSSNIDLLLPLPSSFVGTTLDRPGEVTPAGTSGENVSEPSAASHGQVAEKKARPTSALRSFKLVKRIKQREMEARQEVPAPNHDLETASSSSSQFFEINFQAEVLTARQDAETKPTPTASPQIYKDSSYEEVHTSESSDEAISFRSSVISTEPFPAYEEFYPESPTLPSQTSRTQLPASDQYQPYQPEESYEYYPCQAENQEDEQQHTSTQPQQPSFTSDELHEEPVSYASSTSSESSMQQDTYEAYEDETDGDYYVAELSEFAELARYGYFGRRVSH
ncbi:uncharacterized protein PAC_13102 [Phialocephala subalpina]|uniref:Uncharacterized protein n=1 Tax=Phialocephala subalpina TaxID=576137 RepID=A0A1L7XDV3_9HELO|nr:uncharacterized protein PAC_13102 [Phialocephala subalpina]